MKRRSACEQASEKKGDRHMHRALVLRSVKVFALRAVAAMLCGDRRADIPSGDLAPSNGRREDGGHDAIVRWKRAASVKVPPRVAARGEVARYLRRIVPSIRPVPILLERGRSAACRIPHETHSAVVGQILIIF